MVTSPNDEPMVLRDSHGAVFRRVEGMRGVRYIEIFLAGRKAETGDIVAACYNPMFGDWGIPAVEGHRSPGPRRRHRLRRTEAGVRPARCIVERTEDLDARLG